MSAEKVGALWFHVRSRNGNDVVRIIFGENISHTSPRTEYREEAKEGTAEDALLLLAKNKFKKKIDTKELTFTNVLITAEFLEKMKKSVLALDTGRIEKLILDDCTVGLNTTELEDFISPMNLKTLFIRRNNFPNGMPISDTLLKSVKFEMQIYELAEETWFSPNVTDALFECWRNTTPPVYVNLLKIRTSFTMKAVFDFITVAFKNRYKVCWDLGPIDCGVEDGKYLLEFQKISGLTVHIEIGPRYKIIIPDAKAKEFARENMTTTYFAFHVNYI